MSESESQRLRRENVLQYKRIAKLEAELRAAERLIELHEERWEDVDEDHVAPGLQSRFREAQEMYDRTREGGE